MKYNGGSLLRCTGAEKKSAKFSERVQQYNFYIKYIFHLVLLCGLLFYFVTKSTNLKLDGKILSGMTSLSVLRI